jgi:hypothetical protein
MKTRTAIVTIVLLLIAAIGLQALNDRRPPMTLPSGVTGNLLYVRSPEFMKRAALSYDALAADVYWIRAIQHYGRTKLSKDASKQYDLLYPLLDLTTSLDPYFDLAYRFGAIFLAERHPAGAGRPDLAIALLKKGLAAQPKKWEFAMDIGYVHYFWLQDYHGAADWFQRASEIPGSAIWLAPLAAVTLAQGGNRQSSRLLWQEVAKSEVDWMREQARFRLAQLDALDQIDALSRVVAAYRERFGPPPASWLDLVNAGMLRGIPVDPERTPYVLDPSTGAVTLSPMSLLNPLPTREQPAG